MDTGFWKGFNDSFLSNWYPGIVTFVLGIVYFSVVEKIKLRQKLKNDILEIYMPVLTCGSEITIGIAENGGVRMSGIFKSHQEIYPEIFTRQAQKELSKLLVEGFIINGYVNKRFLEPISIENLIKSL
ncbi:hypothetical protein ACRFEN_25695 [Klebsiella pneumoniae]|nr:hypothetical protein [Klebsiella pneumoniae]